MLYAYRCEIHGEVTSEYPLGEAPDSITCGVGYWQDDMGKYCPLEAVRIFGFKLQPVVHNHWNPTVGKEVRSHKHYADELKRKSDEQSERTGVTHDYQPLSPEEMKHSKKDLGVTEAGMDATRRAKHSKDDNKFL